MDNSEELKKLSKEDLLRLLELMMMRHPQFDKQLTEVLWIIKVNSGG
jgi:hypothetical protein